MYETMSLTKYCEKIDKINKLLIFVDNWKVFASFFILETLQKW